MLAAVDHNQLPLAGGGADLDSAALQGSSCSGRQAAAEDKAASGPLPGIKPCLSGWQGFC